MTEDPRQSRRDGWLGNPGPAAVERLAWVTIAVCLVALSLAFWAVVATLLLLVKGGAA